MPLRTPEIARMLPTSVVVKLRPPVTLGLTAHNAKICTCQEP
jgi:hypothetical protein